MSLRPKFSREPEMDFYQLGESWPLLLALEDPETNLEVVPTAATITITTPGGSPLVTDYTLTPVGGDLPYAMGSGAITTPGRNYRALITVTVDGETYTLLHLFDAVRFSPVMPLAIEDLADLLPDVTSLLPQHDLSGAQIMRFGWQEVMRWLQSLAVYPDLVLSSSSLKAGCLFATMAAIHRRATADPGDRHEKQADYYDKKFEAWKTETKLSIDLNVSGTIDGGETQISMSVVSFGRFAALDIYGVR